ncbi:MAG: transketolase [Actinomycetota bacterium]|nr:transketolase [Actinomycetota bacterium]
MTTAPDPDLDRLAVATIRGLAMDAPRAASSGHPGTAMALAPLAHVLFTRILRHDPGDPTWPDRDRFVLSNGHASILLYSMLHLSGTGVSLDDLRAFRQWGSITPGHPERGHTPGIEVTTGPLGQGFANAVGMAIAERFTRARFGPDLCSHHTFVVAGDGCFEEGISHEAASLAGHLGLDRLVCVYDDNHISIDGPTELAYSDDVPARFAAYGWSVVQLGEAADDLDAIEAGLRRALSGQGRPTLVVLRSHIGFPSPHMTDTAKAHGDPFSPDEIRLTKEILGIPPDTSFWVPDEVVAYYARMAEGSRQAHAAWAGRLAAWEEGGGDRAAWDAAQAGRGLPGWEAKLPSFDAGSEAIATRQAIKLCLDATAPLIPGLVPGSADLTGNTGMALDGATAQSAGEPGGNLVHYGIREHGMGAVMTGMAAHGGVLPVGGTFFVFSDYMRGAVRVAALSGVHVVYSWTHDSVGLGEDGPTHQPVEHLAALRAMPGLRLLRPADANETAQAWRIAVEADGPVALVLSRQKLPVLAGTAELAAEGVPRGAYVLAGAGETPDVVLVGTGSEVALCLAARDLLATGGIAARVVSFPSWDLFAGQAGAYRDAVLPPGVPRLAVEAGTSFGWERYADDSISIDRFGASAPGAEVMAHLGFTADHVASRARALVRG